MTVIEAPRPTYPAIGNNIALDFTNTVDLHASDRPQDRIGSYSDLIDWALQAGGLTREQAAYLIDAQKVRPDEAATALETARGLREAIYRLVLAATTKRSPTATDLESLNRVLREGFLRLKVTAVQEDITLQWADDDV
ncbi:MAG: ABATE domain-containing protein, partial [bacterium]